MARDDFYWMTWGEFMIRSQGYMIRRDQALVGPRLIANIIYNSKVRRGHRKTLEKFYPLPFVDEIKIPKIWSKDEAEDLIKRWSN